MSIIKARLEEDPRVICEGCAFANKSDCGSTPEECVREFYAPDPMDAYHELRDIGEWPIGDYE